MGGVDLLERARQAQLSGDYTTAETGYREVLKSTDPKASDEADTMVAKASWNLAIILRDQHGAFAEAANVLERARRTRTGVLRNDPQMHTLYAQLRFSEFDARTAAFDLGPENPALTAAGNAIAYTPAPLAALREGVRAYMDVLQQAGNDAKWRDEATAGITHGAVAYATFAGVIGLAAINPGMKAVRDRALARGKLSPNAPLASMVFQYAEGREAEVMSAKTAALRQGAAAAMMDTTQIWDLWRAWAENQKAVGLALMKPQP